MLLTSIDPLPVLRIFCGLWFLPHCIGKIQNFDLRGADLR